MGYRQLTQTQRYQIHARHGLGMSQRQIARELGVHSSTISRELRRNATASGYDPEQAQALSDHRRRTAWKPTKRLPGVIAAVVDRLREEWSPEQISSFMARLSGVGVSHQWIYSLIWDDKARGGELWRHLRQPKRRSKHRAQAKSAGLGKIPNRVGIEQRPAEVEDRLTIGHWEGDTVIQGHKQSRVMRDRPSLFGPSLFMEVGKAHLSGQRDQRAQGVTIGAVEPRAIEQCLAGELEVTDIGFGGLVPGCACQVTAAYLQGVVLGFDEPVHMRIQGQTASLRGVDFFWIPRSGSTADHGRRMTRE